jgi:chemotaxis signal transduction protein
MWKPMTRTSSPASPLQFLIVTLDGRYLALDAESIGGVLTLEEAGHVTNPTLQGMEYRAVDLADRLSVSHDRNGADTCIILLSDHGVRGSIRVTTVEGFLELQPSQILPLPMQFRGPERRWYRGMILFEQSIALILDPTWILGEHAGSNVGDEPGAHRSSIDAWGSAAREKQTC